MIARVVRQRIAARTARQLSIAAHLAAHPASTPTSAEQITINGWVRSCRKQKNISFAVINDGSNVQGVQAVVPKGMDTGITIGSAVTMTGKLVDSPGKGQDKEFQAEWVEIVGESDAETYPIPNTKQGIPATVLRRNAHLRPRASAAAAMLRARSEMAWAANNHLRSEGLINVQTPLITSSDCEGAGEVFRVEAGATPPPPTSPTSITSATPSTPSLPPPPPRYLTVSSQLHLEALASSLSSVYTLSPSFRAENSDTARHLQEFWMLEAEISFLPESQEEGLEAVMSLAERLVKSIAASHDASPHSAYFYGLHPELEPQIKATASPDSPFPRITYAKAIEILAAHSLANPTFFTFKPSLGHSIQTEHEKWLADEHFESPLFVTNYPASQKPWYMLPDSNAGKTVACFDLLVPRLGELIGGSLREHREKELRAKMKEHGVKAAEYEWYLDLRKYGTTRHGGFGMGWERLVAYLTGIDNVRECIAFPRAAEGSRF
ncbi:asparaginyl-tRNA synthetase, partial [Phenoliferia sp. Uapishka_3]